MEIFRTNSPESGPFSFGWRRKPLLRSPNVFHGPEEKSFFTSSLPTPALAGEIALKSPKFSNSLEVEEDSSSLSPPLAFRNVPRPRSASLHASLASAQLQVQQQANKKKTLRTTLTRSRPSSARFGRSRSDSLSLEQEVTTGTYKVENAFAKIKSQLAQLSEEDAVLQERLDRLTLEIDSIQKCVGGLSYTRVHAVPSSPQEVATTKSWSFTPQNVPMVRVSGSQSDIVAIEEESWEEEDKGYKHEITERKGGKSQCMNLAECSRNPIPEIRKQDSLGSCGSLADSEGSLSPGRQTCCIVVVDHDKCQLSPRPLKFNYATNPNILKFNYDGGRSPIKFSYEDDVFFT